ncbi:MAG: AAA family ATPase [Prevotellaceae bacterium]|jgi:SpoVK/Ycf46/Vps4 family AAA+-type ATPase|nr:AAA family ATPase [Prevotellaceae bacterium]
MNCPKCNQPNRDKALYCKWCGAPVISKADEPLRDLVGMESVKQQLQELVTTCESLALRARQGGTSIRLGMSTLITGNTGTGKSQLAAVLQKLLFSIGVVSKPVMCIVDAVDYEEFAKEWDKHTADAKGGILCIENVQKLLPTGAANELGKLDKLFSCMDKWNNDPIVILSGLSAGFKEFLVANPDVSNRFEYRFDLKDFSVDDLCEICARELKNTYGLRLDAPEATAKLARIFKYDLRRKADDFGNGHHAVKKAADIFAAAIKRDANATVALADDIPGQEFHQKSYEQIMTGLDEFVGIDEIKATVEKIIQKMEFERERKGTAGAKREIKDHFLFLGNPGTGKTTIARVFADILNALEVLPVGQLVEVSRKELVAGYVGQTALAVEKYVDMAMGGVLFIDEAYTLKSSENDAFGQEAIDTLLKLVEDRRGQFVAIAAGYTKEMGEFLSANSGMASRFNETVHFRDYNADELTEIFRRAVGKEQLTLSADADGFVRNYFAKMFLTRTRTFGNAREVRNVLDGAVKNQGVRLLALKGGGAYRPEMATVLTRADIEGEEHTEKSLDEVLAELDEFVGMEGVKAEIRALANKIAMDKEMMDLGIADAEVTPVHIVLTGNPGTGKTTLAKKLGEVFKAIGLLPTDKVVEKERKNLVSSYQNETAKLMDKACDEAMGGILFIDEAYTLVPVGTGAGGGTQGQAGVEAVESLMTRMVSDAGKFVVICAGYRADMDEFINNANPGFRRRFTTFLHIDDYTADQLIAIFRSLARKKENTLAAAAEERLVRLVDELVSAKDERFGNAGEMVKLFEQTKSRRATRLAALRSGGITVSRQMYLTIEAEDIPYDPPKMVDEAVCMAELGELIGLEAVKREVKEIADYIKVERAKAEATGKKFSGVADHYLFVGNPGTGKTTVARIMSNIFYALGVLPSNRLVEVTRKDLVEGYVGQTAPKTARVVKRAVGGVLFIDEAYALMGDGFGAEATATLLPMLLDYKGKMVCIAAGYPTEIKQWIDSNSGLESRFTRVIHFEDYQPDELAQIFRAKAAKEMLVLTPEADGVMRVYFTDLYNRRGANFANAREVNNYFDRVMKNQSSRLRAEMERPDFDASRYDTLLAEDMI